MLMIKRKVGESITIGGTIVITVKAGGTTNLAIDAPREIEVVRTELLERKKEKVEANE